MSSPTAIAAVTATLRNLLTSAAHDDTELLDTTVTTKAPSIARNGVTANQLNLFLFGTAVNTAFSNAPMPGTSKNGESAVPPLALVLRYLITVYGRNDDDILGHRLMGRAMIALHDHPLLGREEIQAALPGTDLHTQYERVRITPEPFCLEKMSKLWTSFQTEYQLSTSYEVSLVLIESSRPAKTPLPVLKRGESDQGVDSQPDLIPPYPTLTRIVLPNNQTSATIGDSLSLHGHHLEGDSITLRFKHPRLEDPIEVPAMAGGTSEHLTVQIPDDPANWMVGFHTVDALISKNGEQDRTTNLIPFLLAPRIIGIAPPNPVSRSGTGDVTLTLTCSPELRPDQHARLLLGDREIQSQPHGTQTDTLEFLIEDAPLGSRFVRLRVDGVDSLLVDRSVKPPHFDPAMEVIIQ